MMESNQVKKKVCDSIAKVLKDSSVDDKTVKHFEEIFWEQTKGYSFNRRKTYGFDDFELDTDNRSMIMDGEYGAKLQMSIFNPLVPAFYRDKALEVLNEFLSKHSSIEITSEDSLAVMLEAYIDEKVGIERKYNLVAYLYNKVGSKTEKDFVIVDRILPTDEHQNLSNV